MSKRSQILVIDNDQLQMEMLGTVLNFMGCDVENCTLKNYQKSLEAGKNFTAIIMGTKGNIDDALKFLNRHHTGVPIIICGHVNSDIMPGSLKKQVIAEIPPPFKHSIMLESLHMAQIYRAHCRYGQMGDSYHDVNIYKNIVGSSRKIRQVRSLMNQVVKKDVDVFIYGKSGTGKEVIAKNLHLYSERSEFSFVPVNCSAIPSELLERELFGYEKGAFPGAISSKKGRLEMAHNGTIFLDEVSEISLEVQVKILRALQDKKIERIGGTEMIDIDVRVVAATDKNLEVMISAGSFREDLYYQLNVFPIEMPSIKDRTEDLPLILNDLINRMEKSGRASIRFTSSAILKLCQYDWPGNIREMSNLIERLSIIYPMGIIGLEELPEKIRGTDDVSNNNVLEQRNTTIDTSYNVVSVDELEILPVNGLNLKEFLGGLEVNLIRQALDDCNNIVARAADKLQIRRTTLVEKMRKYGLNRYEPSPAQV